MKLFHRTAAGEAVLRNGFRDGHATDMTDQQLSGVWLADRPLEIHEGTNGDDVLVVEMPMSVVEQFEVVEAGSTYREFLVPAVVVNRFPRRWADEQDVNDAPVTVYVEPSE